MDKPAATDYPVHELISRRWSPRAIEPRAVPVEALRSLLEAARWAPSSYNEQPWSFIVARREDEAEFQAMLGCLVDVNQAWARDAGALILTVARSAFSHNDKPNRHAFHDIGLAAANLSLQATALGLVVHQMGGIRPDKAREVYEIPDGFEVVTGIAIGYPGKVEQLPEQFREAETAPRQRKPQDEIVFRGTWGRGADW
jgi:nitroreductase